MNIGHALRYYRKLSNMTQVQVAEKADINEKYYGEIERDKSSPTLDRLERISYAIGIDLGQLVSYKPLVECERSINREVNICNEKTYECYCNCCGTYFFSDLKDISCPQCGCEYSEENTYIECYV